MQKKKIQYMWFHVTLSEDLFYYYLDFNLGFGINRFEKERYTLDEALEMASNQKGWSQTKDYCINYIKANNGTNESYFADYKGGIVQVVCNETSEVVYEEHII